MKRDVNDIIRHIARREGVSERQVIDDMQQAIDAGYGSPDMRVREQWASMPFPHKPTPQELILYMAGQLTEK